MYKTLVKSGCFQVVWILAALASAGRCLDAIPSPADDADGPVREGPAVLDGRSAGVGRLVADVRASDLDRKPFRLSDFRGRPVVLFMTRSTCPVARKYMPVIAAMAKDYARRGVAFVAVAPNGPESGEALRAALAAAGF